MKTSHNRKKLLILLLINSLVISGGSASPTKPVRAGASTVTHISGQNHTGQKNPASSNPLGEQMLTRIQKADGAGLLHPYLIDRNGNRYTDSISNRNKKRYTNPEANQTGRIAKSSVNQALSRPKKALELPASFDLRNEGLTTPIRDQGITGCCWAFSAIKAIESNCIKNGLLPKEQADLSESHLTWFSYHPSDDVNNTIYKDGVVLEKDPTYSLTLPYEQGGSATIANFTLANWTGTAMENSAPFTAENASEERAMANTMEQNAALRSISTFHLQNVINFDEYSITKNYYYKDLMNNISAMKQSILSYGAMSAAFFYNPFFLNTTAAGGNAYYQSYYKGVNNAVDSANHAITIVGWDDNYSADNFYTRPKGNGAWLIANSYGTDWGDSGYFWLSYYEPSICDCSSFIVESADNYQYNHQYDGYGWGNATYGKRNIRIANIYTANSSSAEELRAVSFYTLTNDQACRIQIYRGVNNAPTDGVLIDEATTETTLTQNGYYTIPLQTPVQVAAGERFSVVITYLYDGADKTYVPLEGPTQWDYTLSLNYHSKLGQSFLYTENKKKKKYNRVTWYDTSKLGYNNVCAKVFSNNTAAAEPLPKTIDTYTLGAGESDRLPPYLTYKCNDTALAKVDENGVVTAKHPGTTSVLVTDETGSYLLKLKIKKYPEKLKLKPSGTKKIKKGKHFRLRYTLPNDSYTRKVTFRSGKPRVASVNAKGRIQAKRKGKTTITVKTLNGAKAKLKVLVS